MLTALERDVVVELCKCNISKLYNQNLIHLYYIRLAAISLKSISVCLVRTLKSNVVIMFDSYCNSGSEPQLLQPFFLFYSEKFEEGKSCMQHFDLSLRHA